MIADSRLYFVCEARPAGRDPTTLLRAAIAGGVDVIQLRDKELSDEEILEAAKPFRSIATHAGIPFLLNDRPDLVAAAAADGCHVGQDDMPIAQARELMPDGALAGRSTHSASQLGAETAATGPDRPDYVSVGPVWETPTKEGRPAAGLDYVRYAAENCEVPWFAIGGIDPSNVAALSAAGARRAVVVRAIRDAHDPTAAARALRSALTGPPGDSAGES